MLVLAVRRLGNGLQWSLTTNAQGKRRTNLFLAVLEYDPVQLLRICLA